MNMQDNVPLTAYSTMRLGGIARHVAEITSRQDIPDALAWAKERNLPVLMVGEGSNIVWKDEGFQGLLLVNRILRFETFEEDETNIYVTAGSGEPWDSVVERTVTMGLSGIEQLSFIPGTAGATPIQNVGAYGREIADVLVTLEAYDSATEKFVTIPASECRFGYRMSRFKSADKHRFYISAITMHLTKTNPTPPFYNTLQTYLAEKNITTITPATIRDAVIAIRKQRLPDPSVVANNGSFFHNPIITKEQFEVLEDTHPGITHWETDDDKVKLSAAWMLEQAGFKDAHDKTTGMGTWPNQPLVLINENAVTTAALLKFKQQIIDAVKQKFGVELQVEPELLPEQGSQL
jgi:UDP-N-acetylmuramate dehydrogenase